MPRVVLISVKSVGTELRFCICVVKSLLFSVSPIADKTLDISEFIEADKLSFVSVILDVILVVKELADEVIDEDTLLFTFPISVFKELSDEEILLFTVSMFVFKELLASVILV